MRLALLEPLEDAVFNGAGRTKADEVHIDCQVLAWVRVPDQRRYPYPKMPRNCLRESNVAHCPL